jgi:hypothetical protein
VKKTQVVPTDTTLLATYNVIYLVYYMFYYLIICYRFVLFK